MFGAMNISPHNYDSMGWGGFLLVRYIFKGQLISEHIFSDKRVQKTNPKIVQNNYQPTDVTTDFSLNYFRESGTFQISHIANDKSNFSKRFGLRLINF